MTGYVDAAGHHEGDGIPTLLGFDGRWTLWFLVRHHGELALTSQSMCACSEDEALLLAAAFLLGCGSCEVMVA